MKTLIAFLLLSTAAYGQFYADVDMIAMRVNSPVPGAKWDEFSFSPRVELGYEYDTYGLRTRYWHFEDNFEYGAGSLGPQFDVLDLEATKKIGDLTLSGGFRVAGESFTEPPYVTGGIPQGASEIDTTQFGLTFAIDGNTRFCGNECWSVSGVYGARLSLLQGQWNNPHYHDVQLFIPNQNCNDNQSVIEAHAGIEARYGWAFTRLELEMQRWTSDTLGSEGWGDLNFLGIGTTVGVRF